MQSARMMLMILTNQVKETNKKNSKEIKYRNCKI